MQKFDTTAPIATVLAVPAGRIRLIAADRADATVEVLPADPSKSRDVKTAERTEVAYADGVLRVEVPKTKNGILGGNGSIEVTVQLPAGSRVEAEAAATEFRGVGRLGEVVFEGAYGQIKIDEAAGLRLNAADGDVEVGRLTGPAEISTARGDIRIAEATGGTLTLTTQKGDIAVGAAAGVSASLNAGTAYGRVDNSLRNDGTSALNIQATTAYGDITARSL
ncbi:MULTISPECIES: DUF4097 family beta strand repeat-containing protein [Streptomyces]|jgi:hypothetical protein|uniref:DUF4097 domain-containing protein n=1 Tax=Streptomyces nymphaeiformis TaxID=2663842 RepID=A0A7W7U724_9ACTN|nr:DUF4097 family beta strand repeat-containing protein [Streptomyces nymphaeiformis]MBB4986273.1 hypothetical protein [Streptomyces nymphaeiformis]